jgi:peptidoglycan/xylan/chitin deacetylase (PgdA/CDA1 family)
VIATALSERAIRLPPRVIRAMGDCMASPGRSNARLCIVNYHRVLESRDPLLHSEPDIGTFRWQMELLAECFNVLPLHDAVKALAERRLPPRAVCITFDDGYRSVHDNALPILKEFGLPATVFVTTGHMMESNMWNDRILEAFRNLPSGRLDLSDIGMGAYSLEGLAERRQALHDVMEGAKYRPPHARLAVIRKLEELAAREFPHRLMLSPGMIARLSDEGVEIGGHTITHPILTCLDDEAAQREIAGNKHQLEAIIGRQLRLFAYPNGKAGIDFDARHVRMVREAGYAAAFTTERGAASPRHDPYQIPRDRPWDSTPLFFALRLLRWLAH